MKEKKGCIKNWDKFNVMGFEVRIARNVANDDVWFCSYVTIPNSQYLKESYLGYPTYQEGDEFGFDTAHGYNDKQGEAEKLADAIRQVQSGIEKALEVLRED